MLSAALTLCLLLQAAALPRRAARPNLISIVADDLGRWAVGAYGNAEVRTPNLDRLAREGIRFTNAVAATPVCSPSRATWFTGRYPSELGIRDWISSSEAREGVGLRHRSWVEDLKEAGYETALFGKWHLGTLRSFHPTRHGFDTFLGFLGGGNRPMDPVLEEEGRTRRFVGPLPDILTDAAIAFLERKRTGPFLICLHFRAPHLPYGPVPEVDRRPFDRLEPTVPRIPWLDRGKLVRSTRAYYASIHSVDRNVGRLLAALDRLKLAEDTIVLFTSDHGYNEGRHGIDTKGNGHWIAGGVRGPKRPNMWETSIAIPWILRWPGRIPPGSALDVPAGTIDAYRTILGLCGVPPPEGCEARGRNLAPGILGRGSLPERPWLFGQYDLHNFGLAYLRMVRGRRFKLVKRLRARGLDELYDLREDPGERRNLYARFLRDPSRRPILDRLLEALGTWRKKIGDD